jgi:serine/threonine protein phosphatase PrpC
MLEQIKTAYTQQRRVRVLVCLGLFAYAALLYGLSGGFPPWAWRFLLHTLPQVSQLWAMQGSAVVIPLLGLILLSLSLLILWGILLVTTLNVALYWWRTLHERQHFAQDLQEAERMAELAVRSQERNGSPRSSFSPWQPEPPTQPVPAYDTEGTRFAHARQPAPDAVGSRSARVRQPAQPPQQQPYAVARASRVVGSSGLVRVPSATLSADSPTLPPPAARPGVEQYASPHPMPGPAPRVSCPSPPQQRVPGAQPAQPISRQPMQSPGAEPLPSAQPRSSVAMREQFRIVPRQVEEPAGVGYDTLPSFPVEPYITTQDTFPDNDVVQDITDREASLAEDDEVQDDEAFSAEDDEAQERETEDTFPDEEQPADPLRLLVGIGLDPGIARKNAPNEDTLFAIQGMRPTLTGPEPTGLFIVADGMGGHANGQEASKQAVHALSDTVVPTLLQPVDNDETFSDLLKDGVHRANLALYRRNREQEHMMGTTLTAALVVATTAYIVNVGDSRTYLYRPDRGLRPVTRDHSVVARLVEDGVISTDEVYTHPRRNQIYRCLGEHASVEVDMFQEQLQADDVLVLCSDGLWEMVRDEEIQQILASSNAHPSQISTRLIQAALTHGGADNVSVIVICVARQNPM